MPISRTKNYTLSSKQGHSLARSNARLGRITKGRVFPFDGLSLLLLAYLFLSVPISLCSSTDDSAATGLSGQQLLQQHCQNCHNTALKQGKLDLTTREGIL